MIFNTIRQIKKSELKDFDCGSEELNAFLKRFAHQNDKSGIGRTFVLTENNNAIGFITLCSGALAFDELPKDYSRLPRYPIPIIRIARLGVDKRFQGKGYGKELLGFAFEKIALLCNFIGVKFVVVDAKNVAKKFYEKYGFITLPTRKNTLVLPIETILKAFNNR